MEDKFIYQWNIFKANILGSGPFLILPASCLWIHCIQGTRPLSSRLLLPSQNAFFSVHTPSSCGRWWRQGTGGFQHPRLAGPCQDQLSAFTTWEEENGIKIRPKAKAVLSQSLWSCLFFFFFNTKLSDPECPCLKINLKIRLSSLCYLRTIYYMQLHLLF